MLHPFLLSLLLAVSAPPATQPDHLRDNVMGAKGLDQALERLHAAMRETPALSPQEAQKHFKPRSGLAVDLIASEPQIRQPVCINFDERGRMWVVQYIQYPFPAGLKVVEYDQYIRAKFDRMSPPPPHQFRGNDKVTILEDVDHDGSFRKVKTFVEGLNIATSALPGRGGRGPDDYGVWVLNPPYLLFYPDKNRDDVPDGDPIVHLSGFGIEDTHAAANNLTWGPDGWLYGCQGSTCTAHVKVEITGDSHTTDFLGQAIWRYHPETHRFEIFAEGGGNTFGLEFDSAGRAYSGTNWGRYRGLHFVQGGYYIKSWGKHGPLTNPYAFGFFDHMPHIGNADRLSNTFIVYDGGLLGPEYDGKILSPNPLQSRLQVTRMEPLGSSYRTIEEPFLVTTDDGWFRPVDLKAGPDGAIYVADFYEKRINHVDPRDTWDRSTGRIWRVRPADWKPGLKPFDLEKTSSAELVSLLESKNRWDRSMARRVLGDRQDRSVAPALREMLRKHSGVSAVEALWALNAVGALDDASYLTALGHHQSVVRMWAARLLGDTKGHAIRTKLFSRLMKVADSENDPQVLSQLASTAKRLPAEQAIPLLLQLLPRDSDASDVHIPLLLWWAVEDKAVSARDLVVATFSSQARWKEKLSREVTLPRLARRYAAEPTPENQEALAKLLQSAPGQSERQILLSGVKEELNSLSPNQLQPSLLNALKSAGDPEIALRLGDPAAQEQALRTISDESASAKLRTRYIDLLAQLANPNIAPALLDVAASSKSNSVRKSAITALAHFDDPKIGDRLVALYSQLPAKGDLRPAVISTLLVRSSRTISLLNGMQSKAIPRADVGPAQLEQIRQQTDPQVAHVADVVLGAWAKATSAQKEQQIARVKQIITTGPGDPMSGRQIFTTRCAICHTLFGHGAKIGPDLTGYERRNAEFLLVSIVDPSAYIREEFAAFRIRTQGGETFIGLITDRGPNQVTLEDASGQKTQIPKNQILEERALSTSLMPEGLLDDLNDQQLRDLFAYVSSPKPPAR